jgi:hypothetical protein
MTKTTINPPSPEKGISPGRKRLYQAFNKLGINDLSNIEMKRAKELYRMMTENDVPGAKQQDDE